MEARFQPHTHPTKHLYRSERDIPKTDEGGLSVVRARPSKIVSSEPNRCQHTSDTDVSDGHLWITCSGYLSNKRLPSCKRNASRKSDFGSGYSHNNTDHTAEVITNIGVSPPFIDSNSPGDGSTVSEEVWRQPPPPQSRTHSAPATMPQQPPPPDPISLLLALPKQDTARLMATQYLERDPRKSEQSLIRQTRAEMERMFKRSLSQEREEGKGGKDNKAEKGWSLKEHEDKKGNKGSRKGEKYWGGNNKENRGNKGNTNYSAQGFNKDNRVSKRNMCDSAQFEKKVTSLDAWRELCEQREKLAKARLAGSDQLSPREHAQSGGNMQTRDTQSVHSPRSQNRTEKSRRSMLLVGTTRKFVRPTAPEPPTIWEPILKGRKVSTLKQDSQRSSPFYNVQAKSRHDEQMSLKQYEEHQNALLHEQKLFRQHQNGNMVVPLKLESYNTRKQIRHNQQADYNQQAEIPRSSHASQTSKSLPDVDMRAREAAKWPSASDVQRMNTGRVHYVLRDFSSIRNAVRGMLQREREYSRNIAREERGRHAQQYTDESSSVQSSVTGTESNSSERDVIYIPNPEQFVVGDRLDANSNRTPAIVIPSHTCGECETCMRQMNQSDFSNIPRDSKHSQSRVTLSKQLPEDTWNNNCNIYENNGVLEPIGRSDVKGKDVNVPYYSHKSTGNETQVLYKLSYMKINR